MNALRFSRIDLIITIFNISRSRRRLCQLVGTMLLVTISLTGCVSPPEPPENLLTKPEMVAALIEIHILESKVNKRTLGHDSIQAVYDHYEWMLFEDLDIDSAAYNASLKYYLENPTELSDIYEAVVDSLQVRSKNVD